MKPEILLKAYIQYQSEEAFRELVAGTLDEVYSTSFRITQGASHLASDIAVSVYLDLARKASVLRKDVVLASWLRARTCRIAVRILHAEDRAIDWSVVKREKNTLAPPADLLPAPLGLAIRIGQSVFLSATRPRRYRLFSPEVWWPGWMRPLHLAGAVACGLAIVVWWHNPFHRHNPIIRSEGLVLTPSSFAQLAGAGEMPGREANTNIAIHTNRK
jgi:hypothetical protein